ncbi:afadin isoform X2 [Adelges cooleyi]|uniref:afadin isoform X2 n=1 Tax=Adelges cooleyi TaxID=133065 RepID=UPI00217FF1C3|nr:afadin isoform X2 [Adelges cooleyi]
MNPEMTMAMKRHEEREALRSVIQQWNANRLDLFELSEPNEELLFHGVMRFYFQEPGTGQKVATKCIRVASDATSQAVIETLIEKFRPDMRMLSVPEYALYEIHENGDERKLGVDEKPLLVQLNWHKDDREGRFLLRRIDEKTNMPAGTFQEAGSSFKRKLSKREKKQLKKQEKLNRAKSNGLSTNDENDAGVAEKLYTELPETSFTRSISNPEAVMRRRRQQKLERKLQAFRSKDGGPDTGGTLKIYGESLCRDVPYKTLLLSIRDTAQQVVKEMLAKYGLDKVDPLNFCLVQVNNAVIPNENNSGLNNGVSENKETLNNNNREYILDDDECPLAILMNHPQTRGSIMFHVRRRPADYHPRKRKKKPTHKWNQQHSTSEMLEYRYEDGLDRLPFFLELNADGLEMVNPKRYRIHPNVTEVGCERQNQPQSNAQCLQLSGPNIQSRHCVIAHTEGIVTVTPCSQNAETYVNGQRIFETTILQNGSIVKFGRLHNFRFLDPCYDERPRPRTNSLKNVQDYYDSGSVDNTQHSSVLQQNFETTFDVDGNIETRSTSSQGNKDDTRSQRSITSSRDGNRMSAVYGRTSAQVADNILPCVLEVREETEEAWIHAVTMDVDPSTLTFKHAPAYCLYLLARYRASTSYRPDVTPMERANRLSLTFAKVATILYSMIQGKQNDLTLLSFWLAIVTELRQFLHSDRHLSNFLMETIEMLHDTQQAAMRFIVECILEELMVVLPDLFTENSDADNEHLPANSIVSKLGMMMTTLREGRVNASLTIQIYNQVFRFINSWAFNRLITADISYYTRVWGARLKSRISRLQAWAERQGLEVSADCQLALISQAADLLHAPKYTGEDLASITSTCFKLNSLQLKALLVKYQPAHDEPRLPHELIDNVVRVAENLADELARSDGREIRLEEDDELMITFVQPEEGFSYEVARGVPPGLIEFIQPLQQAGMCRLTLHPNSSGLWTVYFLPNVISSTISQNVEQILFTLVFHLQARSPSAMSNKSGGYSMQAPDPDVQTIRLHKSNNGMGLSIVAAKGAGQERLGIYIKSVVKGGAADADGRLQAGDQLLKVDGQSLVGITQEKAAEYLVRTGPIVSLEVAKQGAILHGLATLLSQPSPVMTRASVCRERPISDYQPRVKADIPQSSLSMHDIHECSDEEVITTWMTESLSLSGPRRMSERDLPSRILTEQQQNIGSRGPPPHHLSQIQSSKSVPSLHSVEGASTTIPPAVGRPPTQHEVFNPGYNRTSTTYNLQQQNTLRSRSSQNLNDPRPQPQMALRQPSNPNLLNGNYHPERPSSVHPNVYQPQQHPAYQQHVQQQLLMQQQYNSPTPEASGERFYQNVNQIYRNQEHNGYGPSGKMPSPPDERTPNQLQKSFRGSQSSLQSRQSADTSQHFKDRPSSAYLSNKDAYNVQNQGMTMRSQSSRDMLRQDAKLQEMTEEVRRREMRTSGVMSPQQQQYATQQRPPNRNQPYHGYQDTAKPAAYQVDQVKQQEGIRSQQYNQPMRATVPEPMPPAYRESPPPPPPPPTSTHPLYQTSPQRTEPNRYMASGGEAPRGGYYQTPAEQSRQQYQYQGTNPWQREEKEKEAERRREAARLWRDQQLSELIALGPNRTVSQEEQLRALRLEKEFERRAQEEGEDEEEDDQQEANERVQQLMRSAQQQSERRGPANVARTPNNNYNYMNGSTRGPQPTPSNGVSNDEKERLRRLKEMKSKQVEMEAMREAELKLKRKEEELKYQQQQQQLLNQSYNNNTPPNRLNRSINPPNNLLLDNSGYGFSPSSQGTLPSQRLDNLVGGPNNNDPPQPPERGSSYAVMSQVETKVQPKTLTHTSTPNGVVTPNANTTPKRVSFQDPTSVPTSPSPPLEKIIEDPDNFIDQAETMLASPRSPDVQFTSCNTPGVIGSQEVYRDPRQRLLAEQQKQQMSNKAGSTVPEKLSFKEKMKMFAMETGEDGTPKDKVKISKAQREIDNLGTPTTPLAN